MEQNAIDIYNQGCDYYFGTSGYSKDLNKAAEYFQKAADAGYSHAMHNLGIMHMNGEGFKQDYRLAVDWFYRAIKADNEHFRSAYELGCSYYFGRGVEKDLNKAYQFFDCVIGLLGTDSQESIVPWCFFYMGYILSENNKLEESIKYFLAAAEKGTIPEAWYNLGWVVEKGAGSIPPSNTPEASRDGVAKGFYEKAADLGDADAMAALGRLYMKYGEYDMGKQWIKKGASLGSEDAKKLLAKLNSGGCYVATAVYGSYDCPQVWTLRRYRDYHLAKSWHGKTFIKVYYSISPTLVKWFGKSKWFIKFFKPRLDSMVKKLNDNGFENTPYKDKQW